MKRLIALFLLLPFWLWGCSSRNESSRLSRNLVVTSIVPIATMIENITYGAGWQVEYLVKPALDNPHAFSLKPSDAFKVEKAALVFAVGCGMDPYLEKAVPQSRKRYFVDLGRYVFCREASLRIRGNPHWWLDPYLLLVAARKVRDTFVSLDGANSELYARNYASFKAAVEGLLEKRNSFRNLPNRKVASLTAAFEYMFRRYGLREITLIPHTGYTPSGNDLTVFINSMTRENLDFLVVPTVYTGRIHKTLASEYRLRTGQELRMVYLDPLGYDFAKGRTVFVLDMIAQNLQKLYNALSGGN